MTPQHVISQLLDSDSAQYTQNLDLLKKIIIAAYLGRLQINGLPPDNKIALGNYLFDNEQMMFDFTRLSDEKRALFMQWFLDPHQEEKTKVFLRGITVNEYRGFTAEVSLSWWGRIVSWFQGLYLDYWKISDLDLSLKKISNYQLTGIEMCQGSHGILIGFNQFLVPGTGTKYKDQNDSQQEPLGNTKRVFITDKLVDQLISVNLKNIKFESVCKSPHPQSIEVSDPQERLDKMYDYRKMQRFMSMKPWYIRIWNWLFPWLADEKVKSKSIKEKQVVPLYETKKIEIYRFLKSHEILVRERKPDIENIVFCGGGAKIFAHIGVWKALNEAKIRPEKFAGSSAGAIMALMCYLGYSAAEIEELFKHFKHEHLVHFDININGISEAHSLKTALDYAIAYKLKQIVDKYQIPYPKGKIDFATLEDIRQKCPGCGIGKELVVTATNKRQGKTRYFSLLRSPTFEVSEAVKTSASFPIVYRSTVIDGEEHNDGGVLNNFPTEPFFDDHTTLLESEYGNNLKVLAVKFDDGPERKAIDRVMDRVYRENIVLNWIYRLLTGVSDPASGWEKDRLKLRKYACQSIVINVDNVSSSSFTVGEETRKKMIESGYEETQSYLKMRYHKNESEEYENEEFMYETFSSLGELLSYCCYRGDRQWFDRVYQLLDKSTVPNRIELLKQAQELKALYFNSVSSSLRSPLHDDHPLTFFGNEIPNTSTGRTENHEILLAVYPVFLKLSQSMLKDSTDKKIFDYARHSFLLKDPFACLEHFAKISNDTHLILHIVINLLKELKKNPSKKVFDALSQVLDLLNGNKNLDKEEYFARWDLSFPQCLRMLRLLNQDPQINTRLFRSMSRKSEPLQTVVSGVFYEEEDESDEAFSLSI
ncbi:phospholipase, patatin family [Legionella steigerwaltii]|uniref:Phospholipase, patatin family n=1 Tax=Legionella steigerwaltii TaxID=460 RepID=A0A378L7X1_9GAMM|nr:Dot/Icm T4SS effector VpdC [Legionella steigerwaltii]KTD77613.1 phospholipase, patatin family [Legionella steigerwaltii]STY22923.1 phospholipase, patatin family [Legionella steigerwaltii]